MPDYFKNLEQPFNLLDEQTFETNRRGEITAAQQKQLKSAPGWGSMIVIGIAVLVIGSIFSLMMVPFIMMGNVANNLLYILCSSGLVLSILALLSYGIASQVMKAFKVRQDIRNCAIRQGQGELVHGKKGYAFDVNGNTLSLPGNLANGLLPGTTYQIYYLEASKVLLSARTAYQTNPALTQVAINNILAAANGFSPDDVFANQNGEVTFAQRSKLIPNILFGVAIILGSTVFTIPFIMSVTSSNNKTSAWGLVIVFGIVGIMAIAGLMTAMKSLLDLLSPKLQQYQSRGHKEQRMVGSGRSRHMEYSYMVGGQRFVVNHRAYTALIDGLQYRVYYLLRSGKLISIEAVDVDRQ